ncbi:MAG TPA: GNAT family protein, partial [Actinopolymorphaceae bacterium]
RRGWCGTRSSARRTRSSGCRVPRAPDESGMVEIACSVSPEHRRQGYGRSMLIGLLRRAEADAAVTTVRATISPDNTASLATIAGLGFVHVGEQWDERDGRELVFEAAANRVPAAP